MPFDPSLPANHSPVSSAELRNQFNGLQEEIDDRPDFGLLGTILQDQTAGNVSAVANLSLSVSNPPTQAQVQAVVNKLNELLTALKRM